MPTPMRRRVRTVRCRSAAHREHRTERDDQDDHRCDQAVDLAFGHGELGEQIPAVLDLQAIDRVRLGAVPDDLRADVGELGERSGVRDVQLRKGDRAVGAVLLGAVVRAGDGDVALVGDEREQVLEGCSHRRVRRLLGAAHAIPIAVVALSLYIEGGFRSTSSLNSEHLTASGSPNLMRTCQEPVWLVSPRDRADGGAMRALICDCAGPASIGHASRRV